MLAQTYNLIKLKNRKPEGDATVAGCISFIYSLKMNRVFVVFLHLQSELSDFHKSNHKKQLSLAGPTRFFCFSCLL